MLPSAPPRQSVRRRPPEGARPFRRGLVGAVLLLTLTFTGAIVPGAAAAPVVEAPGYSWEDTPEGTRYVSPAGDYVVGGAIDQLHRSLGGGRGELGYPVSALVRESDVLSRQSFERGWVQVDGSSLIPVTGAVAVLARQTPSLGRVTGPFTRLADGTGSQRFEGGVVHTSAAASFVVLGEVATLHEGLGGTTGVLGAPRGRWIAEPRTGETAETTTRGYQVFAGGVVYTDDVARAVLGEVDVVHRATGGGGGTIGYPRGSAVTQAGGSGGAARAYQIFERGVVYASSAGVFVVSDGTDGVHRSSGGGTGALGYPIGRLVRETPSLSYQQFENGVVYTGPTGSYAVVDPIDRVHRAEGGGSGSLGYPTSGVVQQAPSFSYQQFQSGVIYRSPAGTFPVVGEVNGAHRARGGGSGSLGYPVGALTLRGVGTQCQAFERAYLVRISGEWQTSAVGSWFLSPALAQLRNQINAAHPTRDRTSDGTVGDLAHQARVSDHNPDRTGCGVVRAFDIDKDLRTGDPQRLAEELTRDSRVAYVIFRSKIWLRSSGSWSTYTGSNPHETHIHVSLRHGIAHDQDDRPWTVP